MSPGEHTPELDKSNTQENAKLENALRWYTLIPILKIPDHPRQTGFAWSKHTRMDD